MKLKPPTQQTWTFLEALDVGQIQLYIKTFQKAPLFSSSQNSFSRNIKVFCGECELCLCDHFGQQFLCLKTSPSMPFLALSFITDSLTLTLIEAELQMLLWVLCYHLDEPFMDSTFFLGCLCGKDWILLFDHFSICVVKAFIVVYWNPKGLDILCFEKAAAIFSHHHRLVWIAFFCN